jgi:hypothetical protein
MNVYPALIKLSNYSTLNTSATYAQAGNPRQAGVVQGLYLLGDEGSAGSAVAAYSQVAYRYVLGYTDENGNEILGAPSDVFSYINNTSTAYDMMVALQLPNTQYLYTSTSMPKRNGVFKDMFVRVYRTKNSGGVNIPPGDD